MTADSDQAVIDLLAGLKGWSRAQAVTWVRQVRQGDGALDYEAVVQPLKLSGGQVALRWTDYMADRRGVVEYRGEGLWYHYRSGWTHTPPGSIHALQHDLEAPSVTLTPVLRADTFLAEGGD